jgi:anti-sigma-K factor RskA
MNEKVINTESDEMLVADYLGGEMSNQQRKAFEARMEREPELLHKVMKLKGALEILTDGMQVTERAPVRIATRPEEDVIGTILKYGVPFAKYAAVGMVAFFVGMHAVAPTPRAQVEPIEKMVQPVVEPGVEQLAELKVDSGWARGVMLMGSGAVKAP